MPFLFHALGVTMVLAGCATKETFDPSSVPERELKIAVDASKKYQKVVGFGGMVNPLHWTAQAINATDIDTMFKSDGLGYNMLRIYIDEDRNLWNTDVAIAKQAQSYGALILASPWSPPGEMKNTGSNKGGKNYENGAYLLPENYGNYAAHLRDFVDFMASKGVKIDVLSFQNEPDWKVDYSGCEWEPEQMLEFVKQYGRMIGDAVRIIPGESLAMRRAFTDPLLHDAEAVKNFDIIGGHIYGGGLSPYPLAEEKGKEVWMTEHLLNENGKETESSSWSGAITFAKEIHDCMEANFSAYVYWYLKRFYAMLGDGEYGTVPGKVLYRGQVLSHYAKYAAGKQRIKASLSAGIGALVTAYESEQELSLIIINPGPTMAHTELVLPQAVKSGAGIETTADYAMKAIRLTLSADKKTATVALSPQSVVSLGFAK
jgi:O-glycosyl hydrolase